jgi:hypothetical protein
VRSVATRTGIVTLQNMTEPLPDVSPFVASEIACSWSPRAGGRPPEPSSIFIGPFEQGEIGPDLFRKACEFGLESLVSKRADRPYRGGPSKHWVKVKRHPRTFAARPDKAYPDARLRSSGIIDAQTEAAKVQRRALLLVGGRTVVAALVAATGGPSLLFARDRTPSSRQHNGCRDRYSN